MIKRLYEAIEKKLLPEKYYRTKEEKSIIRTDVRERRRNLSAESVLACSAQIMQKIEQCSEFIEAHTILIYYPFRNEVDTRLLIERWCDRKQFLLPVVKTGNQMELWYYTGKDNLKPGKYGILEPRSHRFAGKPDLIIMPGVAFDYHRNRLGRGRGFYDRLLAKWKRVFTIAVAYDFQVLDSLPTSVLDRKVSCVCTPTKIIR